LNNLVISTKQSVHEEVPEKTVGKNKREAKTKKKNEEIPKKT
jgi:hypothetical protein